MPDPNAITFRPYQPSDRLAFRTLNEAWIQHHFRLEPKDLESLGDPERHILAKGGHILIAADPSGLPVGCCALIPMPPDYSASFELAKMTIAESHRGQGLGLRFLQCVVTYAKQQQSITRLYLETNTKLQNAIRLYEAVGFRHLPSERVTPSPYDRANVFMELFLNEHA